MRCVVACSKRDDVADNEAYPANNVLEISKDLFMDNISLFEYPPLLDLILVDFKNTKEA